MTWMSSDGTEASPPGGWRSRAKFRAMLSRAFSRASGSLSIAMHLRRSELDRGNCEHPGAGADVDDALSRDTDLLQQFQAQPRRRVMAGAETHRRFDDDDDSGCGDPGFGIRGSGSCRTSGFGSTENSGMSHGGATVIRPTVMAVSAAWLRRAQSSSSTSMAGESDEAISRARTRAPPRASSRWTDAKEDAPAVARHRVPGWRAARKHRARRRAGPGVCAGPGPGAKRSVERGIASQRCL